MDNMLYKYSATTPDGQRSSGTIEAANIELAVNSLQTKNLIIMSIDPADKSPFLSLKLSTIVSFFERIKNRDIVIFSRQLATFFEAKVSTMASFKMLITETDNPVLRRVVASVLDDVQGGVSLSQAMSKHPDAFSRFYVSMVKSAEESGKLDETFTYLADYMERSYELSSKAKNALIYPAFIISALIVVLILMMVYVIPNLKTILTESGQTLPFYTQILIGLSNFFINFGVYLLILLAIGAYFLWRYKRTENGKVAVSRFILSVPLFGPIFKKFYISRITDNLETSLSSGISMVRALEIASDVAGDSVYGKILVDSVNDVKAGESLSVSLGRYKEVPSIVSQMIKIGEETGKLNFILKTLSRFYRKEVNNA
ncbi:MAG: Uncharacterized protein Athens071424_209, partial [Parcubacteria group bacterium Athens0714_24]